jgi:hypothetical protein
MQEPHLPLRQAPQRGAAGRPDILNASFSSTSEEPSEHIQETRTEDKTSYMSHSKHLSCYDFLVLARMKESLLNYRCTGWEKLHLNI